MTIKNENLFKTLVISDLDGTLLNNEKRITEYTEKTPLYVRIVVVEKNSV